MGGVERWAMAEQASFWEQPDLLALIDAASPASDQGQGPAAERPRPPAAEPSPPPGPAAAQDLPSQPLPPPARPALDTDSPESTAADSEPAASLRSATVPSTAESSQAVPPKPVTSASVESARAESPPVASRPSAPQPLAAVAATATALVQGAVDHRSVDQRSEDQRSEDQRSKDQRSLDGGCGAGGPLQSVPAPDLSLAFQPPEPAAEPPARRGGRSQTAAAPTAVSPSAAMLTVPVQTVPVLAPTPLAASPGLSLPSCPERLLVLDTETTALSRDQGQCIEVGAVLFHVPSRAVLMQVSFLLPCPSNPAEPINGIAAEVSRLNQPWQAGLTCFEAMVAAADAVVAHNVSFDRQWFGHGPLPPLTKPWICSMEDIRWPAERHLRATPSVRDLALAYGIPVWAAHRALTDCIYLIQVFERSPDLELLLQLALEPRRLYRACLGYAERHRAKEAGFRWNEPVRGAWCRRLSEREVESLSFVVEPVDPLDGVLPRTA